MNSTDSLRNLLQGAEAVIFDFDNVLVDSEPFHYEAYARVFAKHGHVLDRDEYWLEWTSRGGGAEGEIHRYGLPLDASIIREEKDPIYSSFCRSGAIKPFPESKAILELLRSRGLILAIASGSYEEDIRAILRACAMEHYFSTIVGKDRIARWKPNPDTYLVTCRSIGIPPQRCIAIEDAEKGILSAHAAGMKVILVRTEITRNLEIPGAELEVCSLEELENLLRSMDTGV